MSNYLVGLGYLEKKLIRQVTRTLHKKSPSTRGTLTRKPLAIGLTNELSSLQYLLLLIPGQVSASTSNILVKATMPEEIKYNKE